MKVGLAIYNILSNDSDITSLVSTRIFPLVAPQSTEFPFILYDVDENNPSDTKDGVSKLDTIQSTVSCYAKSYSEACDIADKIRTALDRVSGTYNTIRIQSIQFDGLNDIFDDNHELGIYRKALDFNIRQNL